MILYDSILREAAQLLSRRPCRSFSGEAWPDGGSNQLIFREQTSCELGGGSLPALGATLITSDPALAGEEGVVLCGPDIPDLSGNVPYARLAFVQVRDESLGAGTELYRSIRRIEYARYHVSPQGFLPGISVRNQRETARVSTDAKKAGLTFAHVGRHFLDALHQHPAVEKAKVLFITDPEFDFAALAALLKRADDTTLALDHLLQKVKMDCHACTLKDICAEVEELCKSDAAIIAEAMDEKLK